MALPSAPNSISMNQVNVELGRGGTTLITMNDAIVRTLAGVASGTISMDNLRGKSSAVSSIEYLIVGGGGGAGTGYTGGGGGAGGFRTGSTAVSTGVTYTITVGAGGGTDAQGSLSRIVGGAIDIRGAGGGRGGNPDVEGPYGTGSGFDGGSGSGGCYPPNPDQTPGNTTSASGGYGNTPATSPSQGNNGGSGATVAWGGTASGGGGGAGGNGGNGYVGGAGAGGSGVASSISGSSVTYAGGGGGGADGGGSPGGAGGAGGGGSGGGYYQSGTSGASNTGGGGGGKGEGPTASGSGGSGIVIVRYPNTYPDAASTTGSPTYTNTGGYKIYKFTGSGSISW